MIATRELRYRTGSGGDELEALILLRDAHGLSAKCDSKGLQHVVRRHSAGLNNDVIVREIDFTRSGGKYHFVSHDLLYL